MVSNVARSNETGAQEKLLSIGQVLTRLKPAFPDLTPSKVRFLEEQGLICPQRTDSGYRKFSSVDVERIRFILSLQRDRYLPLKVIKSYIDDLDKGKRSSLAGLVVPADALVSPSVSSFYSREELVERTGAPVTLIADAVSFGFISGKRFGESDVRVVELLAELARYGIEPRHLRAHRAMVDREAGLVESIIGPIASKGSTDTQARAERVSHEVTDALAALHGAMLVAVLSHTTI